jgi:hypothetical protein
MSFSIKPMPVHAMIISTLHHDFDTVHEIASYVQDLRVELDRVTQPATFITVVDEVEVGSGDVINLLDMLTQGETAVLGHPNVKSIIVVTTNDLITFDEAKPGKLPVTVTRTLADAVAQAT